LTSEALKGKRVVSTQIHDFYELLDYFSTNTQQGMCKDMIRALQATKKETLADWFSVALADNSSFKNLDQPFLRAGAEIGRLPIAMDDQNDNGIIALMDERESIRLNNGPDGYQFRYVERQVPTRRIERAGFPRSGAGGIDYIAHRGETPILGEIKRNDDQNPFYALIQLLTYLSEMATGNQVERAKQHNLFLTDIAERTAFDLHILLVDFNDRGAKRMLIELTRILATEFKRRINSSDYLEASGVVGQILCIKVASSEFADSKDGAMNCLWFA
jgi:hypothetical protein